nr:VanW family protein [Nocardioides perillae]
MREGLADRTERPVTVVTEDGDATVAPADAGLEVDVEASVEAAGADRSWQPQVLWDHWTGGEDLDAVVSVDGAALDTTLEQLEEQLGTAPEDGEVGFRRGQVRVVDPVPGEGFDREAARDALVAAYLSEDGRAELDLETVEPAIDEADVQDALDGFANPAVSGPVTLVFEGTPVRLQPREFTPALAMVPEDGRLVPQVDREALQQLVGDRVGDDGAPVDATVRIVDGRPQVVPAQPGVTYDPADVEAVFLDLVASPGERRARVEASVAEPELTTAEVRELGITEVAGQFTTYYPHADYRNVNLGRAAELIDGTLLLPGETFSLNDTVGERTRENGFTEGFVINDGILVEDLGGGVSQMATTIFNAMFFAGYEDVEHKPHSFYIDRYPVGREATVAWGAIDLRFRNDSDHGVLIDTAVSPSSPGGQGSVTVRLWSTKEWDVESITSDRYNFTEPATRRLSTPDCYPNSGYGGFDVDVTRVFRRVGESEVVRREVFTTTYTPSDTVVCVEPGQEG